MDFSEICQHLNIDHNSLLQDFTESAWSKFQIAMKKKAIRTLSFQEAFLGWLLILKYKPKVFLELGSQHGHSGLIWWDALKRSNSTLIALDLGNDPRNSYSKASIGTMEFLPDDEPNLIKVWGDAEEKLPKILQRYDVEFVFHDSAHTWDHVKNCVDMIKTHNPKIIQTCHDCGKGLWNPDKLTQYGYICAERPIFDMFFLDNPDYFYAVFEDKFGYGLSIFKD